MLGSDLILQKQEIPATLKPEGSDRSLSGAKNTLEVCPNLPAPYQQLVLLWDLNPLGFVPSNTSWCFHRCHTQLRGHPAHPLSKEPWKQELDLQLKRKKFNFLVNCESSSITATSLTFF